MNNLRRFDDEFFRAFDRFMGDRRPSEAALARADWSPSVDVTESEGAWHIHAELPAVRKEDIKVNVEHGVLTLSGERRLENKVDDKERKVHRVERSYGRFSRSFTLPDNVDADAIKATYKDGVLDLDLPKRSAQAGRGRAIPVE